jgi:hypothetical protein
VWVSDKFLNYLAGHVNSIFAVGSVQRPQVTCDAGVDLLHRPDDRSCWRLPSASVADYVWQYDWLTFELLHRR